MITHSYCESHVYDSPAQLCTKNNNRLLSLNKTCQYAPLGLPGRVELGAQLSIDGLRLL